MTRSTYIETLEILGFLGLQLRDDPDNVAEDNRLQLAQALIDISRGIEPAEALGIKRRPGERTLGTIVERERKLRIFEGWLAVAMKDEPDGLALSLEDAVAKLFENGGVTNSYGWTYETTKTYASAYLHLRKEVFDLPE